MIVWSFRHLNKLHLITLVALLATFTRSISGQTDQLETSGSDDEGYYDYYGDEAAAALKTQNRAVPELSTSTKTPLDDTYNYDDYQYDDTAYDYSDVDYQNDPKHQFIGTAPNDIADKNKDSVNIHEQSTSTGTYTTQKSSPSKLWEIMAKPGILAGLVGGAIIGVLTAVLLIMFIVYRMKKKDEGSYALEETKKPLNAYDYRHCPTKEFYA